MQIRYVITIIGIIAAVSVFYAFISINVTPTVVSLKDGSASESKLLQEPKAIFITRFQTLPGSVGLPLSISIDNARNVLVEGPSGVFVFDQNGAYLRSYASLNDLPYNNTSTYDPHGNRYIIDPSVTDGWITKLGPSGTTLASFGNAGDKDGQFGGLINIDVDNKGNVYVADYANNRIQVFDLNGDHLLSFGGFGFDLGNTPEPTAITVDDSGIYVASEYALQKFEPINFK